MNETLSSSLVEAKETREAWREEYITDGPHAALSNLTPMEFAE